MVLVLLYAFFLHLFLSYFPRQWGPNTKMKKFDTTRFSKVFRSVILSSFPCFSYEEEKAARHLTIPCSRFSRYRVLGETDFLHRSVFLDIFHSDSRRLTEQMCPSRHGIIGAPAPLTFLRTAGSIVFQQDSRFQG